MKYLNSIGIVRFWNNIKSYIVSQIPTKVSELDNDSNYLTSVPDHDASKITTGTIDIARLPQGALERLAIVADESARFALTSSNVQVGDVVKQSDTGLMYMVVDESNLNNSAGYVEFTAGTATSVPWSGITDKPTNFVTTDTTQTISGAKTFSSPVKTAGHKLVGDFSDLNDAYYNNELCAYAPSTLNNPTGGYGMVWVLNTAVNIPDNPYTSWINQIAFYYSGIKRRYRSNGGAWGSWENLLTESTAKPSSNNTQDLGSSSYQWNNTYTNKLYLNGTEFGLGTANTWTGTNTFPSVTIKDASALSNGDYGGVLTYRDNQGNRHGYIQPYKDTSGTVNLVVGSDNGNVQLDSNTIPYTNNTISLGSSTNQWNNVYAKGYYYNGTEFQNKFVTLDTNQIITAYKRFKHPRFSSDNVIDITQTSYESAINVGYVDFVDDAIRWWGDIEVKVLPDASSQMIFYLSNWKADGTQGVTGFALDYSKDFSTVNFTSGNGITNLGTSSYQWKTVHAKNYYYNGTEFQNKFVTLDTAQTITWSKEFTSSSFVTARSYRFRIKNDSMVLGTVPSEGNQWTGFQFIDKNDATISEIVQSFQSNGNSLYQINVFPNETNSEKRSLLAYTYNSTSGANHIQFSSHLIPQSTNTYNVGDTSRQWLDTCTQNLFLNGEKYTSIPLGNAGDDLNNCFLTTIGIAKYYVGTFAQANNVANLPNAGIPFAMKSETVRYISNSDKIIHQRIIQNGIEYTRVCSGTAWSSWVSQYALKTGSASTGGTVTNTYFKIASFEVGVNKYFGAILQVQDLCYTQKQAVITINIRTNVDGTFQVGRLYLHNSSEISPENFILCYKEDTDKVLCELYYYQTSRWEGIRFSVLSETMHSSTLFDIMTVYNAVQSDAVASLPTGYTTIQSTFMPLSEDLIPTSSNLYTLGSSNNQWNKVYSNEYYYNGTQWGLDKANIWTQSQTISINLPAFTLQDIYGERDKTPGNTRQLGIYFCDKTGATYSFINRQHRATTGTHLLQANIENGTYDYRLQFYLYTNGGSDFMPSNDGVINLGNSSNKWKTLNGLNPGALSLPDYNSTAKVDISGSITPDAYGNIRYTPTINGWLYVCFNVSNATTNDPVFYAQAKDSNVANANFVQTFFHPTSFGSDLSVFFPVTANKEFIIQINFTGHSITKAHIIPCLGNV